MKFITKITILFLAVLALTAISYASPQRVISTSPHITEILLKLGTGKQIVGVTKYCKLPPEYKKVTIVGDMTLNREKLIALHPDLIIVDASFIGRNRDFIKKSKIPMLQISCNNIKEFKNSVRKIADAMGCRATGEAKIKRFEAQIAKISARAAKIKHKKRVFFEIWNSPLTTVGKNSFITELIQIAGGAPIYPKGADKYGYITAEYLLKADPEIVFLTTSNLNELPPYWKHIKAYRDKKIFKLKPDLFVRPSFNMSQAAEELQKMIIGSR